MRCVRRIVVLMVPAKWTALTRGLWTHDDRTPVFTFALPDDHIFQRQCWWTSTMDGSMNGSSCRATVYALYLPNQFLMMHQLFIMLAVCLTAIPTAILVHYFVLPRRPKGNDDGSNGKWSGVLGNATVKTVLHHLVAWGMLIPFWIVAPGRVIDAFGVQNLNVRFTLAAMIPTQRLFRTLESRYGFTPTPTLTRARLRSFAFIFAAPTCCAEEKKLYPLRIRRGISTLPKVARDQRRPPQPGPRQKLAMPICCVNLDTLSSTFSLRVGSCLCYMLPVMNNGPSMLSDSHRHRRACTNGPRFGMSSNGRY
jgi:hypothetical protein